VSFGIPRLVFLKESLRADTLYGTVPIERTLLILQFLTLNIFMKIFTTSLTTLLNTLYNLFKISSNLIHSVSSALLLLFITGIILQSCNTTKLPYYDKKVEDWEVNSLPLEKPEHTFFLVGNVGNKKLTEKMPPALSLLKQDLDNATDASSLVFLGNNIAPKGLPAKDDPKRPRREAQLQKIFSLFDKYKGKTFFAPGRKDWANGHSKGLEAIQRQEKFIEAYFNNKFPDEKMDHFLPDDGCSGPEKEEISKDIVMIFVDSQWWIENAPNAKQTNQDCKNISRLAYLVQLKEQINKHRNDHVLIIMHHPLYSRGIRGGHYPLKNHLLPFPGLGSLNLIRRNLFGNKQDINHPDFLLLKREIEAMLLEYEDMVFVSAHENNLQYFQQNKINHHFIISGGGNQKTDYATTGRPNRNGVEAHFVHASTGYAKIYVYENGSMWLEFIKPDKSGKGKIVCFRKKLKRSKNPPAIDLSSSEAYLSIEKDSVAWVAAPEYKSGSLREIFGGTQYRDAWSATVKAPTLDLVTEKGGLKPIQLGGGKASKTIRLENEKEQQYVLRSLNKSVEKTTPAHFLNTWVQRYFQDQVSGLHPYGALVVPVLAEASGIYHTNPQLVYVPRQAAMGTYNATFSDDLYIFEERPAKDRSDIKSFGNSEDIISYRKLIPKLNKNPDNRVDQKWVVKSRLFDIFIHDWDRHDDQWRWAAFEQEDGTTLYRPIPRDRDQAFFASRGFIPWLMSRNFANRQTKTFKANLKDVVGQTYNGKWFDRYFMNELSREDWLEAAAMLQKNLTDEVIEAAVAQWPASIREINGTEIITKLKSRRNELLQYAEKLYEYQAKTVDVRGTNKRDLFEVNRREDGSTEVRVFHVNKKREKKAQIYYRIFYQKETKEVRLYGLENDDEFVITGKSRKGSIVRVIGGEGMDRVVDESKVSGFRKKNWIYDQPDGMVIAGGKETKDMTEDNLTVNKYDRQLFAHNRYMPLPSFGSNVDDGFFVGFGFSFWRYRFREKPYASRQTILFNRATKSNSFNFTYSADFVDFFGKVNFLPTISVAQPVYFNFFGLGNENRPPRERTNFNQVRLERVRIAPLLGETWRNQIYRINFGPFYERVRTVKQENRVSSQSNFFSEQDFQVQHYGGLSLTGEINTIVAGKEGTRLSVFADYRRNFSDEDHFGSVGGSLTTYATLNRKFPVTLALRFGGSHLIGGDDGLRFYNYQTLGNNSFLRGFRNNRYSGETAIYGNTDVRISLFYWKNKILPFEFGVNGGYDIGRVWLKGESSDEWHAVSTAGVWFSPFRLAVINAYYSFTNSRDDDTFTLRLGYYF